MVMPQLFFFFLNVWQKLFALPDLGLSLCISSLQMRTPLSEGTQAKWQNYRHTVLELDPAFQISALVSLMGILEVNCPCCSVSRSVFLFIVPCSILLIGLDREAEVMLINDGHAFVQKAILRKAPVGPKAGALEVGPLCPCPPLSVVSLLSQDREPLENGSYRVLLLLQQLAALNLTNFLLLPFFG